MLLRRFDGTFVAGCALATTTSATTTATARAHLVTRCAFDRCGIERRRGQGDAFGHSRFWRRRARSERHRGCCNRRGLHRFRLLRLTRLARLGRALLLLRALLADGRLLAGRARLTLFATRLIAALLRLL